MPDWEAVIIGGDPAGLTAGLYLCRGNWRTLLIEKETVGDSAAAATSAQRLLQKK
jgi:thioredoxin reductase